ncbi:putative urea ABC transporter substrate-binding protein [Phenylobacterium sp. LjRoot219]|uniref:putative urea ABC transporter substrate-binding protein n=1 Tax=Phenylobacterium sp. LjRoot219 TaxID=3342283 RepID=UPI003ECEA91B
MKSWISGGLRIAAVAAACGLALAGCGKSQDKAATGPTGAAGEPVAIGWSVYAGYMPLPYAQQAGIVDRWNKKYGVNIKMVQINDYVESLNQYTAGKLQGVATTTMDALTIPAAGGHDTTFVVIGDYSNGNDGIVLKDGKTLADIKGRAVNLPQYSVSHFMLARALENAGMSLADVKIVNTSDADLVAAFGAPQTVAVAAWNPMLDDVAKMPGATQVFSSKEIPGELIDGIVMDTALVKANPNVAKAVAGIWYETMALIKAGGAPTDDALGQMGKLSGTDLAGFRNQLDRAYLYADPKAAAAFMESADLASGTDRVRRFAFEQGMFGKGAKSVDEIGVEFPGGKVLGDPANVKLRFDPTFAKLAAAGGL